MKPVFWPSIALLVSLSACGMFDDPQKQRVQAESAMARGDFGTAAVTLRNLIDGDEDDAGLRLLLARTLFMQGDMDGARRTLQAAVDRGAPPDQVALIEADWALQQASFRQVLDATESEGDAFSNDQRLYLRARALQGLQRVPEAMAIYRALSEARPDSADLHLRIAQCHALLGRLDAASAAVDRALALDAQGDWRPVRAEAWILKAGLAAESADAAAVRQHLDQAVAAAPGELNLVAHGQLLVNAIDLALKHEDLDTARRYQGQLTRAMPQSPLARLSAARLGLLEADPAEAIGALQRLVQELPGDAGVRVTLVGAQVLAGTYEQALSELANLAQGAGASVRSVQDLVRAAAATPAGSLERARSNAAVLVALQQPALARLALSQVDSSQAASADLLRARAQIELRNDRPGEAVRLAEQLVSRDPPERQDRALLAEALAANRQYEASASVYETLWSEGQSGTLAMAFARARHRAGVADPDRPLREWLQRQPSDHAVRLSMAATLQQAGDLAAARIELQRVLAGLPPDHALRAPTLNNLALIQARSGDLQAALASAREAYQRGGAIPEIQDTYGWLLVKVGRPEEGVNILEGAVRAAPRSAERRYHHAAALAAAGDRDAALVYLDDLLRYDGDFADRAEAERLHGSL